MTRLTLLFALLLLLPGQMGVVFIQGSGGAPPSGVHWEDTFTRANGSSLTANCSSEGPNGDCGWIEDDAGDPGFAQILDNTLETLQAGQAISDTDTDTLTQYAGVRFGAINGGYTGALVRGQNSFTSGDCFYAFRQNSTDDGMSLRACNTGSSCTDIELASTSTGTIELVEAGDSMGFTVTGTGDSTVFELYTWGAVDVPAFSSWGAPDWTVCHADGDCDAEWDGGVGGATAPDTAKCWADDGGRVGIYDGSSGAPTVDQWRGGDDDS